MKMYKIISVNNNILSHTQHIFKYAQIKKSPDTE